MASATPEGATIEALVAQAREGDRDALEAMVGQIQDWIYNLALRMLWHPADAEDATQEILIRIITNLGRFRGDSAFTTWAYRVAANHLLTTRKRRAEREELTFDRFAEDLDRGIAAAIPPPDTEVEDRLLEEEVKLGCTTGMLLCLDRGHRLAYILGEVFHLESGDGAAILGISPAAFRKRLSRSRTRLQEFLERNCGIVNPANPCRCARRTGYAVQTGRVDPLHLLFAAHPTHPDEEDRLRIATKEMDQLYTAAALFRGRGWYAAPARVAEEIRRVIATPGLAILAP